MKEASRRNLICPKTLLSGLVLAVFIGAAHAQSSDALIEKLVEKGILTANEAKDLREEADNDF